MFCMHICKSMQPICPGKPRTRMCLITSSSLSDDRSNVCTVGFEPNPNHAAGLKELEKAYMDCGWRTHFFTETAVSNYFGTTELFLDTAWDPKHNVSIM